MILVRELRIEEHRVKRLGLVAGASLDARGAGWGRGRGSGTSIRRLIHGRVKPAARALLAWAVDEPAVLGGDFNVRDLELPGFVRAGGFGVDQVFVHGLGRERPRQVLDRGPLSDHAPCSPAWCE